MIATTIYAMRISLAFGTGKIRLHTIYTISTYGDDTKFVHVVYHFQHMPKSTEIISLNYFIHSNPHRSMGIQNTWQNKQIDSTCVCMLDEQDEVENEAKQ